MLGHKGHQKIGSYCWTCMKNLAVGTPGFPRRSRSDGPKVEQKFAGVTWLDGSRDSRDSLDGGADRVGCVMCNKPGCPIPVHNERYKEIVISKALPKMEENQYGSL